MTLDEAIKRAEEVMIDNLEKTKDRNASDPVAIYCFECADECRQLAEWLKELKTYREREPSYEAGYNDAKREIALSGEYKRAYDRGYEQACKDKIDMPYKEESDDLPSARPEKRTETHACDCISRQAAIGLKTIAPIAPVMDGEAVHYEEVIFTRDLEKLPSIESEKCGNCTEHPCLGKLCIYYKQPCGDCISRQDVLDLAKCGRLVSNGNYKSVCDAINELPSIEPERKPGKWEYIQYDGNPKIGNWHCSNCRLIVNLGFEGKPYYHYCPGCGAKMEVQNK